MIASRGARATAGYLPSTFDHLSSDGFVRVIDPLLVLQDQCFEIDGTGRVLLLLTATSLSLLTTQGCMPYRMDDICSSVARWPHFCWPLLGPGGERSGVKDVLRLSCFNLLPVNWVCATTPDGF